jgi:hypothetical protein
VLHARARCSTVQQQSRSASQWKNLTHGTAQHFQPSKCRSQSMSSWMYCGTSVWERSVLDGVP